MISKCYFSGFSEAYFHFKQWMHEMKVGLAKSEKQSFKITTNPAPRGVPVWRLENRTLEKYGSNYRVDRAPRPEINLSSCGSGRWHTIFTTKRRFSYCMVPFSRVMPFVGTNYAKKNQKRRFVFGGRRRYRPSPGTITNLHVYYVLFYTDFSAKFWVNFVPQAPHLTN